jgi:DNA-binding winged helix-turn-helix (wHTH) protein
MQHLPPPTYRFGEFELNPALFSLTRAGQGVHLRDKVFRVLLHLVENRERVVPKEELIERVWKGTVVSDDVLFRCVIDARAALGDDRRSPLYIATVSKAGYRFIAAIEEVHANEPAPAAAPAPPPHRRMSARSLGLAAAALLAMAAYAVLRDRPEQLLRETAWWNLDEPSDIALRGKVHGRLERVDGMIGKAFRFSGNGFVEGGSDGLPVRNRPRTVTAWVRTDSTGGDNTNVFFYGTQGWPMKSSFSLYVTETGSAAFGFGSQTGVVRSSTRIVDGKWHFLAGVYEAPPSNTAHLFVDGALEASQRLPEEPDTTASPWRIGGSSTSKTEFRGDIDDVRVYSRAVNTPELEALYRCSAGLEDFPGGLYLFPVFGHEFRPVTVHVEQRGVANLRPDYSGVQFGRLGGGCPITSLRGADMGPDFRIAMELKVPSPPEGVTSAGPYFRSRRAAPGDGLIGGTSAGYAVLLRCDGEVAVRELNPHKVVAFAEAQKNFVVNDFHALEVSVRGGSLGAWLDGEPLTFNHAGKMTKTVPIPPEWEGPPRIGTDQGTAGVLFVASNRDGGGGQQARNIRIVRQ